MAEQRVGFRGFQNVRSGFQPQQAFDPSQAILSAGQRTMSMAQTATQQRIQQERDVMEATFENNRAALERFRESASSLGETYRSAAEFNLRNQPANNLEQLVEFSGTLAKYVQDFVKKKNEDDYQLGLADVLTGKVKPDPVKAEEYRQQTGILKQAAEIDGQIADQLVTSGNVEVAQEFRNQSRAISGWRAYGQAVGHAKTAAAKSQAFFAGFMNRTDAIIPLPDGRFISPSEAATKPEVDAVLAVAQQDFIKSVGIGNINPMVLAEHLSPTLMAVQGNIAIQQIEEAERKRKETALSDISGQLRKEFSNPQFTALDFAEAFQRLTTDFQISAGLSRGKASDRVVELALGTIASLPTEQAEQMLLELAKVPKIADDPNSISLGSAYSDQFQETVDAIGDRAEAAAQRLERSQDRQAEQAVSVLEKARQDANTTPAQLKALKDETVRTLGLLADNGSTFALERRGELLAEPENVDYTLYRQYRQGIAQGQRPSQQQIEQDFRSGKLTVNMREELMRYSDGENRTGFMKQFGSSFKEAVTAKLREAGAISLNPFGQPLKHTQHVNQVINDLGEIAYKFYDSQQRAGKPVEDNDINQLIETQLPRVIGRYFSQDPKTKEWKTRPISQNPALAPDRIQSTLRGYVPDAGGFDPRTIRLRNLNSGNAVLLNKAEIEDNIKRFQSGQAPTQRAAMLANTNGGLVRLLSHQAQHHGIDPSPIINSPQAQRLTEFQSVAPRATQRLVSGTDYLSQMLQLRRIAEAQTRKARIDEIGKGIAPAGPIPKGATVGVTDMLRLALNQGLAPEKAILMAAVGMAESTGRTDVVNNNPATGDNSFGLWQINMIGSLGPSRMAKYGLRSFDDLKDPETNARVMSDILGSSGINAWGAYKDKRYLQYMSEARRAYAQLKQAGGL